MKNIIFIAASFFLIIWAIGYLAFDSNGMFHSLLVIAIIAFFIHLILRKKQL